jgi:uncharacterized repeat protein (TIGR03803 family)
MVLAFVLLSALAAAPAAEGQSYKVLYNFTGGSDGGYPLYGTPVQDKAGNLYGTTEGGGSGYGTVWEVVPSSGVETVLYAFTGSTDGAYPYSTLALSGNTLYGTTYYGGSGYGVVFAVDIKKKTETVLYTFTGGSDGGYPYGGLVVDKKGNLYGTANSGGVDGYGTLFKVVPKTKKETVLWGFDDTFGGDPFATLTLTKSDKVLYGTTVSGGSPNYGVVFTLEIGRKAYKMLYNFGGSPDGAYPYGAVGLDSKDNIYGTTEYGGSSYYGTVFEVVPKSGKETVLYNFTGGSDGGYPYGGITVGKKDVLYGTTYYGGANYYGTIFEVVKGTESVLHSFDYSDGAYPYGGVLANSKGDLFGTTETGGSSGAGVVWELTP